MHPADVHVHILHDVVEKLALAFMIPPQRTSLAHFYGWMLTSFSFADRTCVAIFFFGWLTEHVTSQLLRRWKPQTSNKGSETT